jgi:hypothetical protein
MNTTNVIKLRGIFSFGLILSLAIIVAAIIASVTFYRVRSFDNALTVTGSAKQRVVSDGVKWIAMFTRTVAQTELQSGYAQMATDKIKVETFLTNAGLTVAEIDIAPVLMEEYFKYNADPNAPREYTLRQMVRVQSTDITKITTLANQTDLIDAGVLFATQNLEYYYSKLADLRVTLLSEAVKDARARAEAIARSTGRRVGTLKQASMGVVQVLQPNSTEIADYGNYDTSTVDKEVMVTVKTEFVLQ